MDTIQEERAMTSKKPRPSRITLNIGFTKYEIVKHVGKILK